ncbi:MAG TPA: hypothetical protein PLZ93_17690 [Nocardioides sp.]|nr:hypothetical protein [Nocardioides sp.]HRI97455.1 hypothetical protein [Nocardioides sp.]HRK47616.1 hypothetical protein [Nocardioides sp.]
MGRSLKVIKGTERVTYMVREEKASHEVEHRSIAGTLDPGSQRHIAAVHSGLRLSMQQCRTDIHQPRLRRKCAAVVAPSHGRLVQPVPVATGEDGETLGSPP